MDKDTNRTRSNPWLYERDGDLNPTWIMVVVLDIVGIVVCIGALISRNPYAMVAALAFLGAIIVAHLISALPRDKAKILANARSVGDTARGIAGGGYRPYGPDTRDLDAEDIE